MADKAIGRVKTVLVSHGGQATISTVIAHEIQTPNSRLSFHGTVKFEAAVQRHLKKIVLKHVHNIMVSLNMAKSSFTLSAVNIGAASSSGIGITVSGFSIDVSAFLAILSCALQFPIRQDIVFTGHIGSHQGDILQVESLPAKCEAAILDKSISAFVYPNLDSDISFKRLKPKEYASAVAAVRSCHGKVKLHEVENTYELLQKAVEPRALVYASLHSGFFDVDLNQTGNRSLNPVATYLTQNNDKRFWKVLEEALVLKNSKAAQELLEIFAGYFIQRKRYPSEFGRHLARLIISLPLHIKRTPGLFPLLSKTLYIDLIQYASKHDHDDISRLHNALFGEIKESAEQTSSPKRGKRAAADQHLLNHILEQLEPGFIGLTITRPYDEARASYAMDVITVESNAEFIDTITAFYAHICGHINDSGKALDTDKLSGEALDVLKKTFHQKHGYNEALAEAKEGPRGGLRYILDMMTEYLKNEARQKHFLKTFKENIDPLDFAAKTAIIAEILKRKEEDLPEEITSQKPERFAEDYEKIVQAFVHSKVTLHEVFRRL